MTKKNEFQPDKPRFGLLDRLYLTKKQRRSVTKWMLYGLTLLALSLLQDVILCHLRIYGASTDLVPCGIFLICILEGTHTGSVFALIASLLYLFSGTAPGPYAMVFLTALSVGVTMFRQAYLQKGFGAAMLGTGTALFLYELLLFAMGLFFGLTLLSRLPGFLITAALSFLAAPALYPAILAIGSIGGEVWKE